MTAKRYVAISILESIASEFSDEAFMQYMEDNNVSVEEFREYCKVKERRHKKKCMSN
jgi:hypothetical protein